MSENFPVFVCSFWYIQYHLCFFQEGMLLTSFLSATATWISWISLHFRTLVRWKGICFLKKRLVGDTRWFRKSQRRFDLHYVKVFQRLRWCQYDTECTKKMEMRTSSRFCFSFIHPFQHPHITSLVPRKNSAGEKAVHLLLHVSGLARPGGMDFQGKDDANRTAIVWKKSFSLISWVSQ